MRTQPNIIVIIMDDLCPGDLSYAGNEHCRTPNIDRIAHEGVVCERHCSGPVCSPARASLMTGRYHLRTRVLDTYLGRTSLDPDEIVLPELLGQAGYTTGCFGKWHLGDTWPCRPEDRFDETLVHRGGGIGQHGDHLHNWKRESYFDPYLYAGGGDCRLQSGRKDAPSSRSSDFPACPARTSRPPRDSQAKQYKGYCTDIFGDATCAFIKANTDRPFFAYLATNAPHTPLQVAEERWRPHHEAGLPENWARVYAMVENIDQNVGKVLATLDACGIADDTLIMFFSDHGPCGSAKDPERGHRPNCDLRGAKGSVYEGGIRVPSFWRWPNGLPAGEQRIDPTHAIDVFTTLCAAAGVDIPNDRPIDGLDLTSYLRGEATLPQRQLFMQWHRGDQPTPGLNAAVIDGPWKWLRIHETDAPQLYKLDDDPREQHDLASSHGERCASMQRAYDAWFAAMAATRNDTFANAPIPIGADIPTQVLTRNDWRVDGGDGWDDSHQGHWDLAVRSAGRYRAVLHFTQPPSEATVRLLIGDQILKQPCRRHVASYEIEVALPAGPTHVRADALSPWRTQSVFQIEIQMI